MSEIHQPELIQGSCLRGEVVFEVTPPARVWAHWHCTNCRRANGAGLVTWAGDREEQVRAGERAPEHRGGQGGR